MRGAFDLVPLFDTGTVAGFAVARAGFVVAPWSREQPMRFTGFGQYTLVQGFSGPADTMSLSVRSDLGAIRFDSPLQNTEPDFPALSVAVDMNDRVCFDKVLTIDAAPDKP